MINPQWLKLTISRINSHGPKDVWAIEIWLYIFCAFCIKMENIYMSQRLFDIITENRAARKELYTVIYTP